MTKSIKRNSKSQIKLKIRPIIDKVLALDLTRFLIVMKMPSRHIIGINVKIGSTTGENRWISGFGCEPCLEKDQIILKPII
jgi:hypothetical protein